jgi:hypothetical protein
MGVHSAETLGPSDRAELCHCGIYFNWDRQTVLSYVTVALISTGTVRPC